MPVLINYTILSTPFFSVGYNWALLGKVTNFTTDSAPSIIRGITLYKQCWVKQIILQNKTAGFSLNNILYMVVKHEMDAFPFSYNF